MFDYAVLFLMLGLAVMALQQILANVLGLRGRRLRGALCDLVRGVKFPAGFREDLLIDRVLADKRINPLSLGSKPSGAVTNVTWVGGATFSAVLKDTLASASPDMLIDGFAKRPDSVRVEIRQEIEGLAPKVVDHAKKHFDGAMAACSDRYKTAMRILSIVLGVPLAILFVRQMAPGNPDYWLMGLGAVLVPILAPVWYGLLEGVLKLRCARDRTSRPSGGGRAPARGSRGKKISSDRGAPAASSGSERPAASGSGGGGASRRRSATT